MENGGFPKVFRSNGEDGLYGRFHIGEDLSITVRSGGRSISLDALSRGTIEQGFTDLVKRQPWKSCSLKALCPSFWTTPLPTTTTPG